MLFTTTYIALKIKVGIMGWKSFFYFYDTHGEAIKRPKRMMALTSPIVPIV